MKKGFSRNLLKLIRKYLQKYGRQFDSDLGDLGQQALAAGVYTLAKKK